MASTDWAAQAAELAGDVLARHAEEVDREARWPREGLKALAQVGFFGLTVSTEHGGAGEGPRAAAAVVERLASQCASTAMIYTMHLCGTQVMAAAAGFPKREVVLKEIAAGHHLTTLAFSEAGSRSHFWAPVSRAADRGESHFIQARKSFVTSAGQADSYIVSTQGIQASSPMESTLYYLPKETAGISVCGEWHGLGLRGNASAPMQLDVEVPETYRLSGDGDGFSVMLNSVLPWFQLCTAAVGVGIAAAATEATRRHLLASKLEHLETSLASLPNLRARLAQMQISVDTQRAFLAYVIGQMEAPNAATMLAVLESKAGAAEAALQVTDLAMRTCGGAAFSRAVPVERHFRDARAGYVMAPTTDVLHDFIGKALLEIPLFE
jgi:alkylation response protein AidB-like acyl-CoA dehydrogenase